MTDTAAAERNKAIVASAYEAFFKGDFAGFFENFADDAVIIEAESLPYGGEYRGRERGTEVLLQIFGSWDDLAIDMEEVLASPTMVAAVGRLKGKSKTTGTPIDFSIVELWRFREGKVVAVEPVYADTFAAIAAMQPSRIA